MTTKALTIDEMFHRNDRERGYCHEFLELMSRFPDMSFSIRSYAPWQIDIKTPAGTTLSCWPHKLKVVNQRSYATFELKSWSEADPLIMPRY